MPIHDSLPESVTVDQMGRTVHVTLPEREAWFTSSEARAVAAELVHVANDIQGRA